MSELDNYWNKFKKLKEAVDKYKNLEFLEFIRQSLLYSGFDLDMIDNVYINEECNLPDSYGCFKDGETVFSYVINDSGQKQIKSYTSEQLKDFMISIVMTAPNVKKNKSTIL